MHCPLAFINDHAWPAVLHVAHMALEGVIDQDTGAATRLAVVGGEVGGLLDGGVWDLASSSFDDDVRAGDAARVQPEVVAGGLMEGDFFVLTAILADQDGKAVLALHIERHTSAWASGLTALARFAFALPLLFALFLNWLAAHIFRGLHFRLDQQHLGGILGQFEIGQQLLDGG